MLPVGAGISEIIKSNNSWNPGVWVDRSSESEHVPLRALAYTTLKSNCSSSAPSSINKSRISSNTFPHLALGLSTLLMTTIGFTLASKAFFKTNLVCGIGPS